MAYILYTLYNVLTTCIHYTYIQSINTFYIYVMHNGQTDNQCIRDPSWIIVIACGTQLIRTPSLSLYLATSCLYGKRFSSRPWDTELVYFLPRHISPARLRAVTVSRADWTYRSLGVNRLPIQAPPSGHKWIHCNHHFDTCVDNALVHSNFGPVSLTRGRDHGIPATN